MKPEVLQKATKLMKLLVDEQAIDPCSIAVGLQSSGILIEKYLDLLKNLLATFRAGRTPRN